MPNKRSSIFQRAYEAGIIFDISVAPKDGFNLRVLYNNSWIYWNSLKEFKQVEYWLKATAKINFGITL